MGTYINPPFGSKEEWLILNGDVTEPVLPTEEGKTLVCLVSNPMFSAAAVIPDDGELAEFDSDDDPRPKVWYLVDTSMLAAVT